MGRNLKAQGNALGKVVPGAQDPPGRNTLLRAYSARLHLKHDTQGAALGFCISPLWGLSQPFEQFVSAPLRLLRLCVILNVFRIAASF